MGSADVISLVLVVVLVCSSAGGLLSLYSYEWEYDELELPVIDGWVERSSLTVMSVR